MLGRMFLVQGVGGLEGVINMMLCRKIPIV